MIASVQSSLLYSIEQVTLCNQIEPMKRHQTYITLFQALLLSFAFSIAVAANTHSLTGTVKDASDAPVSGATVNILTGRQMSVATATTLQPVCTEANP